MVSFQSMSKVHYLNSHLQKFREKGIYVDSEEVDDKVEK
jgi:hypothetical protein